MSHSDKQDSLAELNLLEKDSFLAGAGMVMNDGVWIGRFEVGRIVKRGEVGDSEGGLVKEMAKAMFIRKFHWMII